MSINCEYSSREYQIVLRPDLLINSFETGVNQVIDELAKIEKAKTMEFKVSRSSLNFKNASFTRYIPADNRDSNDFYIEPIFKSRQDTITEPADIVTKISDVDPTLACLELTVAEDYVNSTKFKFELDIHSENGELIVKSASSYIIDLPLDFDQTTEINLSSILPDVGTLTRSGRPIIIKPNKLGQIAMQLAEFNVNLAGQKSKAEIIYYQRLNAVKAEFSFKVKGKNVDREVLRVAKQLAIQLSKTRAIALYAIIHPKK